MFAFPGGLHRVLTEGLPTLQRVAALQVVYAELCQNEEDMDLLESAGISVDREIGVPGPGVVSYRKGFFRVKDSLSAAPRIAKVVLRLRRSLARYDVVYVHGYRELLLTVIALRGIPRRCQPPLVWHCHGVYLPGERPLLPFLADHCQAIIAVSDRACGALSALGIPRGRIHRVYNAVGELVRARITGEEPPLPTGAPGEFTFLVPCASLRRHKGAHIAVAALRNLPSRFVLWVTGDYSDPIGRSYLNELRDLAYRDGVQDRVHFIGRRSDIYSVMRAVSAVVVPSTYEEAFGLAAVEPMLLGVPVVVSERGGLPEVVDFGNAGLTFDPDCDGALAGCLQALDNDSALRHRILVNAERRVADLFNYNRWAKEVSDVLHTAVLRADE